MRPAEAERQQRVREMVQQRTQVMSQFKAVVDVCKAKVHQFCAALRASSAREVNNALLSELRRARPPNGRTLQALVISGGVYTSPTRGDFDLPETFIAYTHAFGRDLSSAFSQLDADQLTLSGVAVSLFARLVATSKTRRPVLLT